MRFEVKEINNASLIQRTVKISSESLFKIHNFYSAMFFRKSVNKAGRSK